MRDRCQPLHDLSQPARRQHQRIAAGEDHLPDLRMVGDIGDGRVHRLGDQRAQPLRPDHFAAEAEAAIDRADMHGLQQHPIRIAMHDAFDRDCARWSPIGSSRSSGGAISSAASGTNWRAIGSFGSSGSIRAGHRGRDGDGIAVGDRRQLARGLALASSPASTRSSGFTHVLLSRPVPLMIARLRHRRPEHLVDARRTGRQHHQPVEAERHCRSLRGMIASAARKSSSSG